MTYTREYTHTKTDIRKVFECFHADLLMLATHTGAMPLNEANNVAHDVFVFAENQCLSSVHIQLCDSNGDCINAHRYEPNENLFGSGVRPGGNSWPYQPNGRLHVILSIANTDVEREVISSGRLRINWGRSHLSTDYSGMQMSDSRQYTSNGYGLTRATYHR